MKKILFICVIFSKFLFAEGEFLFDNNSTPIDANGNIVATQDKSLLGNDTLPTVNIPDGNYTAYNLGDTNLTVRRDISGNRVVYDSNGSVHVISNNKNIPIFTESHEEYIQRVREINGESGKISTKDLILQNQEDYDLKRKQIKAANAVSGSINERKAYLVGGLSVPGAGNSIQTIFTTDINNLKAKKENGEYLTTAELNELNATTFYSENLSMNPNFDRRKTLKETNINSLNNAYRDIDSISSELTNRMKSDKIKCQITRHLMPSFYCPIVGKSGLRFPANSIDSLKVDMNSIYNECLDYCESSPGDYPVISEQVLNTDSYNINFSTKEIFPNYDNSLKEVELNTNGLIPLKYITFKIKIKKPENKTDKEWNDIIDKLKPKVRFDFNYYTKNEKGEEALNILYNNTLIYLSSSEQEFKFPVNVLGSKYTFAIRKAFFNKIGEDLDFKNMGGKIEIESIGSKYITNKLYYCSIKQTVPIKKECFDSDKNAKLVHSSGQDIYICRDKVHKIGPEPTWGAFYTRAQAEDACIIHKDCIPTYISSGELNEAVVYKAEINCVDDPDNTACSDSLCETLFKDSNKTIVNEYYVELDKSDKVNSRYSIKNAAFTGVMRPKINFEELSGTADHEKLFQTEEKDQAYVNMIKNVTYNRDMYRIGTESPVKLYYNIYGSTNNPALIAKIKPNSFDYGSDTNFYVYSIVAMDHFFEPLYGTWFINGSKITVSNGKTETDTSSNPYANNNSNYDSDTNETVPIRFMDRTYAIKTGENNGDWQVFRVIENDKFENTTKEIHFDENGEVRESIKKEWITIPSYRKDIFEKYNSEEDKMQMYDYHTDIAPYFKRMKFDIDNDFFDITITNNMSNTYLTIPGALIRDQIGINHNTSFKRIYGGEFSQTGQDSYVRNATYYLVYSDHKMTYEEILKEIEGNNWKRNPMKAYDNKWGLYEVINRKKYFSKLKGDEELNNNIRLLKKGKPNKLTISVDWKPSLENKGKKAYKFVLLYKDNEFN